MVNPPPNVEVNHLHYAMLATFSHCGLIWFNDDIVEPIMIIASICVSFNSFRHMQILFVKQSTLICSCIDVKSHPPAYTRLSRGRKEEGRRKKWVVDSISSCTHILIGIFFPEKSLFRLPHLYFPLSMTLPNTVRTAGATSAPVDTLTLRVLHETPLQDLLLTRNDMVLHILYKHNKPLREW